MPACEQKVVGSNGRLIIILNLEKKLGDWSMLTEFSTSTSTLSQMVAFFWMVTLTWPPSPFPVKFAGELECTFSTTQTLSPAPRAFACHGNIMEN